MLEALINASNNMLNHLEQNAHPKMLFLSNTLQLAEALKEARRVAL